MQSAQDIYQDHLDRLSRALWVRDFAAVADMLGLPNVMATKDARLRFDDNADLLTTLTHFRDSLQTMGATGYHRICQRAAYLAGDDTRIEGRHTTYVLRGGHYAVPPWQSDMTLELRDGVWKGMTITSDVRNSDCTVLSPANLRDRARIQSPDAS
ncbi:hypothetical protein [Aestuariicoccus sp. MJ-SS9]|uniref:hypothetical protein n=1 Tax=Aestuariicoccus sp. MJ-SS9 TaxID=3079855 RepID=UPI002914F2EF|nr:hypothetical protein [Aestuariicoccus sp. MJ-SS9]MDU8909914.1 hypothetical protein [Aestuariicoccus sp. MJ-SS9]